MTAWTWKTVDWSKVQAGDIIVSEDYGDPTYVEEICPRPLRNNMIRPEYHINLIEYRHEFQEIGKEWGTGFTFPCFADGSLPAQRADGKGYFESVKNDSKYRDEGVVQHTRSFNEAAVIRCRGRLKIKRGNRFVEYVDCNNEVSLDNVMTNTCEKCHSNYNSSGRKLAPRSQWGWDTGESLSDILSSDWGINESPHDRVFEGD